MLNLIDHTKLNSHSIQTESVSFKMKNGEKWTFLDKHAFDVREIYITSIITYKYDPHHLHRWWVTEVQKNLYKIATGFVCEGS